MRGNTDPIRIDQIDLSSCGSKSFIYVFYCARLLICAAQSHCRIGALLPITSAKPSQAREKGRFRSTQRDSESIFRGLARGFSGRVTHKGSAAKHPCDMMFVGAKFLERWSQLLENFSADAADAC